MDSLSGKITKEKGVYMVDRIKNHPLWNLFKEIFLISALTFGGGYVIVPLMHTKFVDELKWIKEEEMIDILAMSQTSPGVFTVNASIMVGYNLFGLKGSIVAVTAAVLPPLVTVALISTFYTLFSDNIIVRNGLKGAQAVVGAIMINVLINYSGKILRDKYWLPISIMILAFVLDFVLNINTVLIILFCGVLGTVIQMILLSKKMGGSTKK